MPREARPAPGNSGGGDHGRKEGGGDDHGFGGGKDERVDQDRQGERPSIRRPLELAGSGPPGTEARVLFPIDPNEFFAGPNDAPQILHAPALAGAA